MNKKYAIYLLLTAAISSTAFFFFPEANQENATVALFLGFASSITQLLAVGYFLASLGSFKRSLKIAYYLLVAGILCFSLVQIIPSSTAFVDIGDNVVVVSASFVLPYAFGSLLMYLGMRKFARMLQVKSFLNHVWVALILSAAAAGLATFAIMALPHPPADADIQAVLNVISGLLAWCTVFGAVATILAWRVREAISITYRGSLFWMSAALAALTFAALHELIVKNYFLDSMYASYQISIWPYLLVGVLFLKASMALKSTKNHFLDLPKDASYVDVVMAMAQKASQPARIDAQLDKVRQITAEHSQALSPANKTLLLDVYRYIEDYLTTEEPLQRLTVEDLRSSLPDEFLHDLQAQKVTA